MSLAQFLRHPLDDSSGCRMQRTNPASFTGMTEKCISRCFTRSTYLIYPFPKLFFVSEIFLMPLRPLSVRCRESPLVAATSDKRIPTGIIRVGIEGYLDSTGICALTHSFHPPLRAYIFPYPILTKSCATRALVPSPVQAQ